MALIWGTGYYEARVDYAARASEEFAKEKAEWEKEVKAKYRDEQDLVELKKALTDEEYCIAEKGVKERAEKRNAKRAEAYKLKEKQRWDYLNMSWFKELKLHLTLWWSWIFVSPFLLIFWERFRFTGKEWIPSVIIHISIGLIFGTVRSICEFYSAKYLCDKTFVLFGVGQIIEGCMLYLTFLVAYNAFVYYKSSRKRAIRTSQLEAKLAKAQLNLLKMQLNPHFLFNSLHAISTLMHRDIDSAERMLTKLGELLRISLDNMDQHEIPLRRELDFLKRYLDIEQIRFGDRLAVKIDISDKVLDAMVPNLILQPIVENAVIHGVSKIAASGRISLYAEKQNNTLVIDVTDNGPGLPEGDFGALSRTGVTNTKARLTQLYGNSGSVNFITPDNGGLTVRLSIPFHVNTLDEKDGENPNDHS